MNNIGIIKSMEERDTIKNLNSKFILYNSDFEVNKEGHVIKLRLNDRGLDKIPAEIKKFVQLEELDFHNTSSFGGNRNKISKIENLNSLSRLRTLNFGYNQIKLAKKFIQMGAKKLLNHNNE